MFATIELTRRSGPKIVTLLLETSKTSNDGLDLAITCIGTGMVEFLELQLQADS